MHSYIAYGLGIRSALPLPELVAGKAAADVVVRLGRVDHAPSEFDGEGAGFWATTDEACRSLAGVGTILVRGGHEIIVDPAAGVADEVLRLSILGPALALLLHQRGRFVLHASAVERGGSAVAFTGGSGWGKSTLAAVLHARGYGLVADDLTAIAVNAGYPTVFPGFPQLKLWPEAVVSLGEAPETMRRLHPLFEKRARVATQKFPHRVLPLRRVYVLAEGSVPAIEPLRPREAMLELLRHWYGSRFGDRLLQADGAALAHFLQCTALANGVTVHRLRRPRSLRAVPDLASLVENDLAGEMEQESVRIANLSP